MLITPEMVQAAKLRLSVPVVLIEDDAECIILDYTVAQLQDVLAQLDEMAPLPRAGSAEALAQHAAWMEQSKTTSRLVRNAEYIALTTVPEEAKEVLRSIRARQLVLMGITLA
jgi:hypothetical protein